MSTDSPPAVIPVPLRTGDYRMIGNLGGPYSGDVGSLDKANPATLRLTPGPDGSSANVSATVGGYQDPAPQPGQPYFGNHDHYAWFDITGTENLDLKQVGAGATHGLPKSWSTSSAFMSTRPHMPWCCRYREQTRDVHVKRTARRGASVLSHTDSGGLDRNSVDVERRLRRAPT